MNKVENIEQEVQSLTPQELAAFRKWFLEFDPQAWDRQIEEDLRTGKLDRFADEALTPHRKKRGRESLKLSHIVSNTERIFIDDTSHSRNNYKTLKISRIYVVQKMINATLQ